MVSICNIPENVHNNLSAKVSNFIIDFKWRIPNSVEDAFPNLRQLAQQITLASDHTEDVLLWKHCNSGVLSLKEAFLFKNGPVQNLTWTKAIWGLDIPPSKSLLIWRLMHKKVPTDENLNSRGCSFPSMCSTCKSFTESSMHLFFECSFALKMWSWLASIINVQVTSIDDIWPIINRNWSPQCKVVVQACIINIIIVIWFVRNQARFQGKIVHWRSAINMVITSASISGNHTKQTSRINMLEFSIMKACRVNIKPPKAPIIREVMWSPPITSWIKINTYGAYVKNPIRASAGGIFRDEHCACLGCFAQFLGVGDALFAELSAAMSAIELAVSKGFFNVWMECDSQLVLQALR